MSNTSLEITNSIAEITIDRPKQLNALNSDTLAELREHLETLSSRLSDTSQGMQIRVLSIRGAGDKAFVAGADISELAQASPPELQSLIALGQDVMNSLEALPIPTMALVDGYALGGGFELALACDLIIASEKAVFGLPEISLGLIPGFGGTQRLTRQIGIGAAKRYIFSGEKILANEAHRLGICQYLMSEDEFDEKARAVVEDMATKAPCALRAAKEAIHQFANHELEAGLCCEAKLFCELGKTQDAKSGLDAFLQKKQVQFVGK